MVVVVVMWLESWGRWGSNTWLIVGVDCFSRGMSAWWMVYIMVYGWHDVHDGHDDWHDGCWVWDDTIVLYL